MRALGLATAAYGAASLFAPDRLVRVVAGRRPGRGELVAARVLGARVVLQGVALAVAPTSRMALLANGAAAVDGVHALSMAGLAAVSARHRRVALASGGLALASAAGLAAAAGGLPSRTIRTSTRRNS